MLKKFRCCLDFGKNTVKFEVGGDVWDLSVPLQSSSRFVVAKQIPEPVSVDDLDRERYFLNLNLEGKQVKALVDTGSTRTYLGKSFLDLVKNKLRP